MTRDDEGRYRQRIVPAARMLALAWAHPPLPGRCSDCGVRVEWRGAWVRPGTDERHACQPVP